METTSQDADSPGRIGGAKVVIAILGAVGAVVLVVLLGFALFEPEGAPCASGEAADNPLVNGLYEPRNELFTNVRDAEAFICHSVPELGGEGWALERIAAERTVPLEFLVEGNGLGVVTLGYLEDASGRPLTIDATPNFGQSYFVSGIPPQRTEQPVTIRGLPGTAYGFGINPDFVTVIWVDETLEHRATAQLAPDFDLQKLVEVLQTLR